MKRYKYLPTSILLILVLMVLTNCNYNGKATIRVTNVGELGATIRIYIGIDQALTVLEPGEYEIYEFEWPGHKDQQVTYIRYPKDDKTKQFVENITIKDGDYLEFQVEFYPEN